MNCSSIARRCARLLLHVKKYAKTEEQVIHMSGGMLDFYLERLKMTSDSLACIQAFNNSQLNFMRVSEIMDREESQGRLEILEPETLIVTGTKFDLDWSEFLRWVLRWRGSKIEVYWVSKTGTCIKVGLEGDEVNYWMIPKEDSNTRGRLDKIIQSRWTSKGKRSPRKDGSDDVKQPTN